jgi:dTDP-4-dehydrorhamnose 3,5-epimerase-like enzyme
MKKIKYKISFKDRRGTIIDMVEKERINAVTLITSQNKSVRGNHYHKKTWQWNYILDGKVKLVCQKFNEKKKTTFLKKGDLILLGPMEKHAFFALTKYSMLVFTKGPRGGKEYENDTFRLKKNII